MTRPALEALSLDQRLHAARSHSAWSPEPKPVDLPKGLYEMVTIGPPSMNTQHMRVAFLAMLGDAYLMQRNPRLPFEDACPVV